MKPCLDKHWDPDLGTCFNRLIFSQTSNICIQYSQFLPELRGMLVTEYFSLNQLL